MSSSGWTSFIVMPELDSGFLTVGAAEMVAPDDILRDAGLEMVAEDGDELYAGNVGLTTGGAPGPGGGLGPPGPDMAGLKSGPTGVILDVDACKTHRKYRLYKAFYLLCNTNSNHHTSWSLSSSTQCSYQTDKHGLLLNLTSSTETYR